MPVIMRIHAIADGLGGHTVVEDLSESKWYLKRYDLEANCGRGAVEFTHKIEDALRFPDAKEAMAEWNRQSTTKPLREDGKPNKPLSGLTIEIEVIATAPRDASPSSASLETGTLHS